MWITIFLTGFESLTVFAARIVYTPGLFTNEDDLNNDIDNLEIA